MKKLIGLVVVAAMVATTAFAEISFGDWGRALWVISGAYDHADDSMRVASDTHQGWAWDDTSAGTGSPRVGFTFTADSDNIGIITQIYWNGTDFGAGDWSAGVWVKPIEWLKFTITGGSDDGTLRSDICLPLWGWDRISIVKSLGHPEEEGWIFPALLKKNISVIATPIDGLTIGGAVGVPDKYFAGDVSSDDSHNLMVQFGRQSALAVGYTIEGVGTIKAGIHGNGKKMDSDFEEKDEIEANLAFELTAVEGLYAAIGAFIPFGGTYSGTSLADAGNDPIHINLGVNLSMIENLLIQFRAGVAINDDDLMEGEIDGQVGFLIEAAITYSFGEGMSVFADVGYGNQTWTKTEDGSVIFGLGVDKSYSNGTFGIAFEGTTKQCGIRYPGEDADSFAWCVPIRIQHWF